jgi:hypothetical protein
MKKMEMKRTLVIILFCLVFAVVSVLAQRDYCFQNDGLKVRQTVSFTITKNKLTGTFESGGYDDNSSAARFEFTGTKMGNLLTIKFADKPPYELPPRTRKIVWTLGTKSLKIPTYGKNYNTMKYSTYMASYTRCKEI